MTVYDNVRIIAGLAGTIDYQIPRGFRYIGEGCSRIAFQGPDGLVYKVLAYDGYDANLDEIQNYYKLLEMDMPDWFDYPVFDYYPDERVIVSEYIPGISSGSEKFEYLMNNYDMSDMSDNNLMYWEGKYYAVDLDAGWYE